MHKFRNGTIHVDFHNRVVISYSTTRDNKHKLTKYNAILDIRKYFFAFRNVNIWSFLHNDIVGCKNNAWFYCEIEIT